MKKYPHFTPNAKENQAPGFKHHYYFWIVTRQFHDEYFPSKFLLL